MSNSIWDSFDNAIDTKALADEVKKSASGSRTYDEVPVGTYEVKIDKLELVASKSGKPMLTCWMNILSGDHRGQKIFMNQVAEQPYQIHTACEFLRSLDCGLEVTFQNYNQFGNLILDVHEKIDTSGLEYALKYGKNNKGYNTYEIVEVYEPEN